MKKLNFKNFKWLLVPLVLISLSIGNAYADTWNKVTSAPDSWAGEYLLVYENNSTSGSVWTGVDVANCYASATISSGVIATKPTNAVSLIIAAVTGGYSIKVNGGTNDGKYIYGSSGSNAMNFSASAQVNTISYTTDCSDIVSNTSHIRWNTNRFRYYKSTTYTSSAKVQLYKKSASCDKNVTITKGTPESGGSFALDKTGSQATCSGLTVTVSNIVAPSGKKFSAITQSGIASGVTIDQSAKTVTYAANTTGSSTINVTYEDKGCTDHYGNNVESATTTSGQHGPIYPFYKYSTRQILYTKADLGLAAGKKGIIKSIYFKYGYTSAMTSKTNVDIYMVNSDITELSTSAGHYVTVTSSDKVYSGALNGSGKDVWNEIVLTTPFNYDGAGNLIVVIDDNSNDYDGSDCVFNAHTTSTDYSQLSTYSDTNNADPSAAATWTGASTSNIRPSTMFCIQEADMVPATVTLMDNGATITEASAGAGVILPSRAGCTGYTFAGWTKTWVAPQSSWTTTAPTIIQAGSYTPSADENLYPVYTKTEGGGDGFKLSLEYNSTEYYIAPRSGSNAYLGATTNAAEAEIFYIEDDDLYYLDGETKTYVNSNTNTTSLTFVTSAPVGWTITNSDGVWTFQSKGTGTRHLAWNYNSGSPRFSSYTGSSTYLYQYTKHSLSTTSYISVPKCCDNIVELSVGSLSHCSSMSIDNTDLATCSSTDADRQVTITVTPDAGYEMNSEARLTFTKSSGTATATYVSGPTTVGATYQFVYKFTKDDNGAGTFGATCTAKTYRITLNNNGATTAGTEYVDVVYNTAPAIFTPPTKEGYNFQGYWTNTGSPSWGSKLGNNGGTWAPNIANYTSSGNWIKAADVTLYAKWEEKALTNYRTTCPSFEVFNQDGTSAADIHLTSTNGVTVYATNACGNLIRVICEHLDAIADLGGGTSNKQNIRITYFDMKSGSPVEVAKAQSPFHLCNDGTSNYNQADGSNININGLSSYDQTYSISYEPKEYGQTDHYQMEVRLQNNTTEAITVMVDLYGRSLPKEFVIAAKRTDDGKWYALPNTLANSSSQPAISPIDIDDYVDNKTTPTKVTNPMNTVVYGAIDRFKNSPNTQFASIRFTSDGNNHLQAATGESTYNMWLPSGNAVAQNWYLKSSDLASYLVKLDPANSNDKIMGHYTASSFGFHGTAGHGHDIYFLPIEYTDMEADIMEWGTDHLVMDLRDAGTATTVKTQIELGSLSSAQTLTTVKKDAGVYLLSQTLSTSDAAKEIKLLFYDGSDALIGSSKFTIPLLVSASDATTSGFSITKANAETCDLVVLNGAKLTIESSEEDQYTFKDLYVYGGGKMVVPTGKYITFDNVYLRGGHLDEDWNYVYSHPQLVLNGTMSNASNLICYDYLTNNAQFYSLALPYDVTLTDIVNPSFSNKRSWQIHGYDGAKRASGSQVEGWYDVEEGSTHGSIAALSSSDHLTAGVGYTFWGAMQKVGGVRQKWSVNRFKMSLASGSAETAKAGVTVTAHGMNAGELKDGVAPNDACWNMLGNPYLADLGGTSAFEEGDLVQGKILSYHNVKIMDDNDNWTGAWEWQANETNVRYVRIPNNQGTEYEQVRFKDATLRAFHHFFIQASASGTFSFDISMRANAAPARYKQSLLPEEMDVDLTIGHEGLIPMTFGLTLNNEFSDGFAIGEDIYEELDGSNMKAYTFTPVGASRVTFNGIPFVSAQQLIPVGYRAPEAGEYTFSYKEDANSVHLEHVWLTDKTLSTVSDLKDAPYVFTTEAGVNDERFALNLVYSDNVITDVESVNDDNGKPQKFIYQDKLYILRGGVIYDATGKRVREVNK